MNMIASVCVLVSSIHYYTNPLVVYSSTLAENTYHPNVKTSIPNFKLMQTRFDRALQKARAGKRPTKYVSCPCKRMMWGVGVIDNEKYLSFLLCSLKFFFP